VIGPSIAADRHPMTAMVVGAIDQQAANAHFAHFAERDFLQARYQLPSSTRSIAEAGPSGAKILNQSSDPEHE
jgi:hypothetical protein